MSLFTHIAQLSSGDVNKLPTNTEVNIAEGLQLLFGVAGAVAVLIVAVAGFRYVLSQGDPQNTAKAKNTIIYALAGLVIIIMAYAIVTFVAGSL